MDVTGDGSRTHWSIWALTGVAALSAVLVIVDIVLFLGNRTLQQEVNSRQQFINQSIQVDRLNREVVAALANLAVRNNDEQIRNLLAEHGITFTANPSSPGPTKGGR